MPQINRCRIINFSYNNNFRNIVDETFDFYQGENALLNLKNGGGKSVLVQLMLQPIIPKVRLMGRKIDDFFKGKKTPSYILIEWKLEDKGGYLLTGIALSNRESQSREAEEGTNNVKYFTFTNHYREANHYDIQNIPLLRKEKDRIFIEEFKDAKKLLTSKDKNKDSNIRVFSDESDDKTHYRKLLESYNIFRDEWDSIVLKINESEGGVIEIFEKSKSSQQLMNDWILKSVEKVVNKDDSDQKKLELMLENLVEEMINNEHYIYEKEVYGKFNIDLESFINKLNSFVVSLDKEKNLEKELSVMYYYLKNEINKIQDFILKLNQDIRVSQEELIKIDIEERSKEFYDQIEIVNTLEVKLKNEKEKLVEINDKLSNISSQILIQQAAREYSYIKNLKSRIAGINEEINKIKNNTNNKESIKNLEYSLKVAYEKLLFELKEKAIKLSLEQEDVVNKLNEYESKIKSIDLNINSNEESRGELSGYIKIFENEEEKIKSSLNFYYDRNLYGEIEEEFIDLYFLSLENEENKLKVQKNDGQLHITKLIEDNKNLTLQVIQLDDEKLQKSIDKNSLKAEKDKYYELENSLKDIFYRHNIDFNRRFNFEENILRINNKIKGLEKREREIEFNKKSTNEKIASLKEGTYHVSKEFRQWLNNNNIDFETGENYLRKQDEDIRNKLINQNPMLPYAFILYDDDFKKIKSMDLDFNINQMVPLLSYSNINESFIVDGKGVEVKNLHFICLYDSKMINSESIESYMALLDTQMQDINEQLSHYGNELKTVRNDSYIIMQFDFDKNYIYEIENKYNNLGDEIERISNKITELNNIKENNVNRVNDINKEINTVDKLLEKLEDKKLMFHDFKEKDKVYLHNKRLHEECCILINKLNDKKKLINEKKSILANNKEGLLIDLKATNDEINENEKRYNIYQAVKDGIIEDDTIENMEERLRVLTGTIVSDLERLEKDLKEKSQELSEKKGALESLNIEASCYIDVRYDKAKYKQLEQDKIVLDENFRVQDDSCRKSDKDLSREQGKLESVEKELYKLTPSPIEPELIKLNFEGRRISENEKIINSSDTIKRQQKLSNEYLEITISIGNRIRIENYQVNTDYRIKVSVNDDFKVINKQLTNLHSENETYEKNINNQYLKIKSEYKEKNKNIENIFAGLDPLIEGATNDNNKYYYLGERILYSSESLRKLIEACDLRLSNLEKSKKDMIQHSYLHGMQVYDEIQKIAENSSINIQGKIKHMLKIEMIPLEDSADDNVNKMKEYIESCINIIKKDMKEDKKADEIQKKINKYMSTRELLNVLSDLGKMVIKAYKVDINEKNSKYKTWEQVMKENSGGERFVSFFALLIALISYTRTSMKYADDYEKNKDTKVLIMDNPFGPISSEHLLRPLFEIAKKYNTQLICLTDLKQNSIMNCFNLIYMIKIRQNVLGTNEFLQFDKQIKNEYEVEKDEKLEKAVFKAKEIEQIKMF